MTIPDLLHHCLGEIYRQHYGEQRVREFHSQKNHLIKAISRYGHVCSQRGWHVEADRICTDILTVLNKIKRTDFDFLPAYLERAIDGHVRQRGEEIRARAQNARRHVQRVISGVEKVVVVEPTAVEVLAMVHKEMQQKTRERKAQCFNSKKKHEAEQFSLF